MIYTRILSLTFIPPTGNPIAVDVGSLREFLRPELIVFIVWVSLINWTLVPHFFPVDYKNEKVMRGTWKNMKQEKQSRKKKYKKHIFSFTVRKDKCSASPSNYFQHWPTVDFFPNLPHCRW